MIGAVSTGGFEPIERARIGFQQLSSGKKSPSLFSPATLEIGRRLLNSSNLAGARNSNINNEISSSQTKSSFVQSSQDTVMRINELTVKANSGILSASDKQALQVEAEELSKSLGDTMKFASFNGKKLMDDSEFANVVSSLSNVDLTTDAGVKAAAMAATSATDMLSGRQAELGAEQIILDQRFEANRTEQANLLDAGSRLTSVDMAAAFSQFSGDMIMSSVGTAVAAQGAALESSSVEALLS